MIQEIIQLSQLKNAEISPWNWLIKRAAAFSAVAEYS